MNFKSTLSTFFVLLAFVKIASAGSMTPADRAFAEGEFVRAKLGYEKQIKESANDTHALAQLGELALYDDRLEDASKLFQALVLLRPDSKDAKRGLTEIDARRGSDGRYKIVFDGTTQPIVSLPFVASLPLPVVQINVNGTKVNFMIDTGAPGVVIDPALAKSLGLSISSGGQGVFAGGAGGKIEETRIGKISLGGIEVHDVPAIVMPLEGAPSPKDVKIDGIIGTSFFYHFLTTIDYAGQHLVLRPRSDSAAIERKAVQQGDAITAMWYVPDHFVFAKANINDRRAALLNIDTGGEEIGIQLTKAAIAANHVTLDNAHPGRFLTPAGEVQTIPFKASVAIGAHRISALPGVYFPSGDQYGIFPFKVDGTLSDKFFRSSSVTFDFEAMRLLVGK